MQAGLFREGLQLPFNLITNHSFDSITVDLATVIANDVGLSDLFQDGASTAWLQHDDTYFEFGYKGRADRDMIVLPWLPFWSSCDGFESHIHINLLLEDSPAHCDYVDAADVGSEPVADCCDFGMQCQYEEAVGLGTCKRWWELAVGSTLFNRARRSRWRRATPAGWPFRRCTSSGCARRRIRCRSRDW